MRTPELQQFLDAAFPDFEANRRAGKCATCGGEVGEFRDEVSRKEFTISGMCQTCQDDVFDPGPVPGEGA